MKHGRVENGHYPALLGYRTLECGGATKHAVLKQRDTAGGKWLFILCLDNGRTMGSALVQRFITLSSVPQECIGTCFPLAYSLFSTAKCAWIAVLIDLLSDDVDVLLGRLCLMIHKATWLRDLFHGAQSGDNAVWCCSWKVLFILSRSVCARALVCSLHCGSDVMLPHLFPRWDCVLVSTARYLSVSAVGKYPKLTLRIKLPDQRNKDICAELLFVLV